MRTVSKNIKKSILAEKIVTKTFKPDTFIPFKLEIFYNSYNKNLKFLFNGFKI